MIHQAAASASTAADGPLTFAVMEARATLEGIPGSALRVLVMSEEDWVAAKEAAPVREKDAEHLRLYAAWRARPDA